MSTTIEVLTVITAVGAGVVGGVFFGFSGFVMPALSAVAPAHGIDAMQEINRKAVRPPLMLAMFGTAALCIVVVAASGEPWVVAGGLTYLIGNIVVTMLFNVPRNNALDRIGPDDTEYWARYVREWTFFNSIRALTGAAAAAALIIGI